MHNLYLLSVWLHILAVVFWLGGMLFLVVVALPVLRQGDPQIMAQFLNKAALRLRGLGWISLLVLAGTGLFQLGYRRWLNPVLWSTPSPIAYLLWSKVGIFCLLIALSVYHDFWFGPKTALAMREFPDAPETLRLRKSASRMGRFTALLALVMVALGVMMVRGPPA